MKSKTKKHKTKGRDIYVDDISFEVEEEDLRKLFSVCGTVRTIKMLTDVKSGLFNGRAFISMSTDAETKDAIHSLDGTRLINRSIRVSEVKPKEVSTSEPEVKAVKERSRRQSKGLPKGSRR